MTIAFAAAGAARNGNDTAPGVSRTGATAGELNRVCVAVLALASRTVSITATPATSTWTLIGSKVHDTAALSVWAYWHLHLGTSEPTPMSWTSDTVCRWTGFNFEFTGVDTTTPVDLVASQSNASSVNCVAPSVDPNYLEDMLVGAFASASTGSWTPDGAMTERLDNAAAANVSIEGATQLLASGAATGTRTAVCSTAAANIGMLIALKDAASTPDTPTPGNHPLAASLVLPLLVTAALGNVPRPDDNRIEGGRLYYSRSLRKVGRKAGA